MHEALNKRLAALPDDTVVYVCHELSVQRDAVADIIPAWTRVHERQRQVRHQSEPVGTDQEARVLRSFQQADSGKVHNWRREGAQCLHASRRK